MRVLIEPRRLLGAILAGVLVAGGLVAHVSAATEARRFADVAAVPAEPVALVFGAGLFPNGQPTPMLAARVDAAAELYRSGRVRKLLMTGDNSHVDYDEVSAMRRRAVAVGVPFEDVVLDHAGFSTYESCYRAHAIFGVERAVLVTQRYHLPRAVYTCQQLGVDAIGLGTPDWGAYSDGLLLRYSAREAVATLNALVQVHVLRPPPTYLGPRESLGLSA